MKCVINEGLFERDGQKLSCPFAEGDTLCGDWCPLFHINNDMSRVTFHCAHTHLSYQIDDCKTYSGN